MQQDKLFGEKVDLLGAKFLGPAVPRSAQDAMQWIEDSGTLDAYRYRGEPGDSERVEGARRAWERMQEKRRADDGAASPNPSEGSGTPPALPPGDPAEGSPPAESPK